MSPGEVRRRIAEVKEKRLTQLDLSNYLETPNEEKLREIPPEVFELEWLEILKINSKA
jgi:hypothetical protein